MQKNYLKTKTLVTVALLIAVSIVIVRFLSFQTEILRLSFGFIPASLCSMLFGPWIGAVASFLSDFLGMLINSKGMSYFPGFGLSEALYGFTYALFLYKKEKNFVRIILCVLVQTIFIDIALGSVWSQMFSGNPYWTIVSARTIKAAIMVPIKIFGIKYIWESVGKRLSAGFDA